MPVEFLRGFVAGEAERWGAVHEAVEGAHDEGVVEELGFVVR